MEKTKYDLMKEFLSGRNIPQYRFRQLTHAIFHERIGEFGLISNLPVDLRKDLIAEFGTSVLSIRSLAETDSKQATKVLFELADGHRIEAVRMLYRDGWGSFCISSQSGCGLRCAFCATGTVGLKRNLTADEITDEVLFFHLQGHEIDSISFMGMGEPFANPATFAALKILTDKELLNLSPRRITISTVGVVPAIRRLSEEFPQVNLTFSLHTPFDEQRSELVPLNRTYPIREIMQVLDEHIGRTRRKVYIAYLMLGGVTDTPAHSEALISLLKERGPWSYLYHVNLIRYNRAASVSDVFRGSDRQCIDQFRQRLEAAGLHVTLRQSFGTDVDAACGQLYARYEPNRAW